MGESDKPRAHLWLLEAPAPETTRHLEADVRGARRDMARWLRALQASGRGISTWPDAVVTRLAHIDATTVRFLLDSGISDAVAVEGLRGLRAVERWSLERLSAAERAEVQELSLMIRIEDDELEYPMLRPEPLDDDGAQPRLSMRSLKAGLRGLSDEELAQVGQRLGIPHVEACPRPSLESQVQHTLRDDHLLGILLATLSLAAHKLLAALVRQGSGPNPSPARCESMGSNAESLQQLRRCGLVYCTEPGADHDPWVPVELQRRLDGVLRAFGI